MLGDNLSVLSDALLTEASPSLQMEVLAERITRHLPGVTNLAGQPLTKQLSLTIEKINQMNYHARWEAGPEGPRIIFGHCPYAEIIKNHPELCQMDEAILKEWVGKPVTQIFKTGKDGSSICVFTMGR
jgi:predicted ArsR family transcriptional regulator